MAKHTIVIRKPKNVNSSYVYHGIRNDVGGFFGTNDAGLSIKRAIARELSNLMRYENIQGKEYDIEVNGKIIESGIVR